MSARAQQRKKTSLKYIWKGRNFFVGEGDNIKYYDRGFENIVDTHFNTQGLRQEIIKRLPIIKYNDNSFIPEFDKLFCPLNFNSDVGLFLGAEKTIVNHYFAPFTVLANVIRDYYSDFKSIVNGVIVNSDEIYNSIKDRFNDLYLKLVTFTFTAAYALGSCSVEDFVMLGSLFYILQLSCDNSLGLVIDDDCFDNSWNGKTTIINLNDKVFNCYIDKLKRMNFCSMGSQKFVNKFSEYSDERTLWFYEFFTDAYSDYNENSDCYTADIILAEIKHCLRIKEEDEEESFRIFNLDKNPTKLFSILPSNSMINSDLIKFSKAVSVENNLFKSYEDNIFIETDVQCFDNGKIKKNTIITNYDTRPYIRRNDGAATSSFV